MMKKILAGLVCLFIFAMLITGCSGKADTTSSESSTSKVTTQIEEKGNYTSKDDVALYVHTYNKLPSNFITKQEAMKLGWKHKGTLDKVAPGKSIGGDKFGNFEGRLPVVAGRTYIECDIDYIKGSRGSKRIIFSNDGEIYYSGDHYKNFEKLY
jgi:guanyl-specific ribonuclease Sa